MSQCLERTFKEVYGLLVNVYGESRVKLYPTQIEIGELYIDIPKSFQSFMQKLLGKKVVAKLNYLIDMDYSKERLVISFISDKSFGEYEADKQYSIGYITVCCQISRVSPSYYYWMPEFVVTPVYSIINEHYRRHMKIY